MLSLLSDLLVTAFGRVLYLVPAMHLLSDIAPTPAKMVVLAFLYRQFYCRLGGRFDFILCSIYFNCSFPVVSGLELEFHLIILPHIATSPPVLCGTRQCGQNCVQACRRFSTSSQLCMWTNLSSPNSKHNIIIRYSSINDDSNILLLRF
ncbi:unnamed protein product [Linum trigynum]|uniref:Secreted protein n=1 Tax=Linum trigynum TaxID=586398 RepID=A0AAV2GU84_9ROSI